MTNISLLPFDPTTGTDTLDLQTDYERGFSVLMPDGRPVDLTGIAFSMQLVSAKQPLQNFLTLSTANGLMLIRPSYAIVTPILGGSGYAIGDKITLSGGTSIVPAILQVTGVAAGAITNAQMISTGQYTALPVGTVTQASTTGAGVGFSCTLSWINNNISWIVRKASLPPGLIPGAYLYNLIATADGLTRHVLSINLTVF